MTVEKSGDIVIPHQEWLYADGDGQIRGKKGTARLSVGARSVSTENLKEKGATNRWSLRFINPRTVLAAWLSLRNRRCTADCIYVNVG